MRARLMGGKSGSEARTLHSPIFRGRRAGSPRAEQNAGNRSQHSPTFSAEFRVNYTQPSPPMKTLPLAAIVALALSSPVFPEDGPREKIRELESKAGAAQAEGRGEEAEKLRNAARELAGRAKAEGEKRDGAQREKPNREQLQAMLEKSRHDFEDAAKNGKQDEATEIKHRIARLETAMREGDGENAGKRRQPERPETAGAQGRLQHLAQAIEHLHAAGLHEPAERLAEQAREGKRQLGAANEAKRPDGEKRPEAERQIAELREGLMNLQRHMQEMQKRLEELSRERR